MKAVRVTKDGATPQLSVVEVPTPKPGPGELLVKIRASAVQPADILNSKGGFSHTTFPRTLGKDFAGTVVDGPANWKGKDVFGTSGETFGYTIDGGQAEYAVIPEDAVALKPNNLSFAQATFAGTPLTTANLTLVRAQIKPSDTVMVLGATGSVGSFVMQIAAARGCKTISVGRHGTDVDTTTDPTLQKARELTGGKGPDVVVDTVGDLELAHAAFDVLAVNGRFSFISAPRQGSTQLSVDILSLYRRQISLLGCNSVAQPQSVMAGMLQSLTPDLEEGKLKPADEKSLSLIGIDQALDAYSGKVKKAVIVFD